MVKIKEESVPKYGLKLKLNHKYPLRWTQNKIFSLKQIIQLIPLAVRYIIFYIKLAWSGRKPIMDYLKTQTGKQIYGVPIGGIGCGSIGRGYKGEFCRYQLKPGLYNYDIVDANQFIITIKDKTQTTLFQSLLSTYERESYHLKSWKSLINGDNCTYTGLYPRSWTEYDLSEYGVKLICRQVSPVIPHNYKDSSLPCAVFVWCIENVSSEELNVTISFTFKNGIGNSKMDKEATCSSKPFSYLDSEGVLLYHQISKMPCTYCLSTNTKVNSNISKCLYFDPNSDGKGVWNQLLQNGKFDKASEKYDNIFGEMGVGLAVQTKLSANSCEEVDFSLVWDMPTVTFFEKERKRTKYYTNIFGSDSTLKISNFSLKNFKVWEQSIYKWQIEILDDKDLPDWYKSAIFNELYFVSDGGSVWFTLDEDEISKLPESDPRRDFGRFAYLEGHEYRMYNTYDVHFYSSFALSMNWPILQQCLQYDMNDAIFQENKEPFKMLYDGKIVERKVKNSVPHDLGDPEEEPFLKVNSYCIHDVSEWRDLNIKFVLQVFRDYKVMPRINSLQYLEDMYNALKVVMEKAEKMDTDGDGIIDNSGSPDQTYDTWVMTGASAYCGSLWLAALYGMSQMAGDLNKIDDKNKYEKILEKGKQSFDRKLWNGKFYNFDIVERKDENIIMSDQLCGHWYLRCCGVSYDVFDKDKVLSSLQTIFYNNVLSFNNGNMGAVNGFTTKGNIDNTTIQSEEVWTGVVYGLASLMLHEGLIDEAWKTAGGLYKMLSEQLGMSFETPEALYEDKYYRAIGYMRPLSIWSMQLAWNQRKLQSSEGVDLE